MPPRPTGLFCRFCSIDSAFLPTVLKLFFTRFSFRFLLALPNFFLRISLPTLFAAVFNFLLPITTYTKTGSAISNKPARTRFSAGMTCLRKNGIVVHPIICASALTPLPSYSQKLPKKGTCIWFEATIVIPLFAL